MRLANAVAYLFVFGLLLLLSAYIMAATTAVAVAQ